MYIPQWLIMNALISNCQIGVVYDDSQHSVQEGNAHLHSIAFRRYTDRVNSTLQNGALKSIYTSI